MLALFGAKLLAMPASLGSSLLNAQLCVTVLCIFLRLFVANLTAMLAFHLTAAFSVLRSALLWQYLRLTCLQC